MSTTKSSDTNSQAVCPICMEELDPSDRNFFPCPCNYQVCLWCVACINQKLGGKCPACRQPYNEALYRYVNSPPAHNESTDSKDTTEKNLNASPHQSATKKSHKHTSVSHTAPQASILMSNDHEMISATTRVIKNNLVYVIGIPATKANKTELMSFQYFGRYGDIQNFALSKIRSPQTSKSGSSIDSYSAYITYTLKEEAEDCIYDVDGSSLDGRVLRAYYGTTKYCSRFLQGQKCTRPNCLYLHAPGIAKQSFSKKDLMSLRGTNFNGSSKLRCNDVKKPTKNNETLLTTCELNPLCDDIKTFHGSHKLSSLYQLELEKLKKTPVETLESHDAIHVPKSSFKKGKSHFGSPISSSLLELLQNHKLQKTFVEPLSKKKENETKPEGQLATHAQEKSNVKILKNSSNEENRENDIFCTCEFVQPSTKTHEDSESKNQPISFLNPTSDVSSSFPTSSTWEAQIDNEKEKDNTNEKKEENHEEKNIFLQETCSKATQSIRKDTFVHSNNPSISRSSSNYDDTLFEINSHENLSFIDTSCYPSEQMVSFSNNTEFTQLTEPLYKMLLNSLTSTSQGEEGIKSGNPFFSNQQDVKTNKCISPPYIKIQELFSHHQSTTHLNDFRFNEFSSNSNVYSQPSDYEHSSFFFSPIKKRQQEQEQHQQLEERQNENLFFNDNHHFSYMSNENEQNHLTAQKAFAPSSTLSLLPANQFFMPVKPSDGSFYPNCYNSNDWNSSKKSTEVFPKESFFYHSLPTRHSSSFYTPLAPFKNSATKQYNKISSFSPTSYHPDEKNNVKNFYHRKINSYHDSNKFFESKNFNSSHKSGPSYSNQEWCDLNVLQSVLPNANINFSNQPSAPSQMAIYNLPTTQLSNDVTPSLPPPFNPFQMLFNKFNKDEIFHKKHMDYEYTNSLNHSSIPQINTQPEM